MGKAGDNLDSEKSGETRLSSSAMPKRKLAVRRKSGVFWPDRIVGALEFLVNLLAAIVILPLFGASCLSSDVPFELRLILAVGSVLVLFLIWASRRLFVGQRTGFVSIVIFSAIGALVALLLAGGGLVAFRGWEGQSGWNVFVLVYCLARLLGWGAKPH